jgi:hypothetical protein
LLEAPGTSLVDKDRYQPVYRNEDALILRVVHGRRDLAIGAGQYSKPGFVFYLVVSTTCVACSVASCSVTENPNAGRSMPLRSASP